MSILERMLGRASGGESEEERLKREARASQKAKAIREAEESAGFVKGIEIPIEEGEQEKIEEGVEKALEGKRKREEHYQGRPFKAA